MTLFVSGAAANGWQSWNRSIAGCSTRALVSRAFVHVARAGDCVAIFS